MQVIIAGGGIGGLTTAISLRMKGFDVKVFESVREIKPLGVGINLLPHAVRVLQGLGLEEEISKVSVATRELAYYNKFGQRIWNEPRGKYAGYQWSQYSIHRGRLHRVLYEATKEIIGEHNIFTGYHWQSGEQQGGQVISTFLDRKSGKNIDTCSDLLIGADGIHSMVRRKFYPVEGIPKFSGIILHRGTSLARPFLGGNTMIMAGSARQKFVAYPISPALDKDGNQLINWIADLPAAEGETPGERDWNRLSDKEKILPEFLNWKFPWLDVPALIEAADAIYEFPMVDRDPLPRWSFQRITLLGDAAHPMYPVGSNGGSQAILDAACITDCLCGEPDIEMALRRYEAIRLPATSAIVLQNRQMGPEQVMQIVEDRAPNGFDNLDDVISARELEEISQKYTQIAGFEKETLNKLQ
jgi:5-methylphenazine-1-carboxylate 1-monooxygenase